MRLQNPIIIDLLAAIEGDAWREAQLATASSPFGLARFLTAWAVMRGRRGLVFRGGTGPAGEVFRGMSVSDVVRTGLDGHRPGDGYIHGRAGTLYVVDADGIVSLHEAAPLRLA